MHVPDGIVGAPICTVGLVGAATASAIGLRRMPDRQIAGVAVLTSVYFVGSAFHVDTGPASVHLLLTGLLAVLLGWRAIVPIAVGVGLQALLLRHGGFSTVGINVLTLGIPAMIVGAVAAPRLARCAPLAAGLLGSLAGLSCGLLSLASVSGVVLLSDGRLAASLSALVAAYLPVIAIESVMTGAIVAMRQHARRESLQSCVALPVS